MALMFSKKKQLGIGRENLDWPLPAKQVAILTPKELRKKLREKLYVIWGKLVRRRDGKCIWHASEGIRVTKNLNGHHIIPKAHCNNRGLYDTENGMALCASCHIHRLNREPDEYCAMRDKWLAAKRISYERLRAMFAAPGGSLPDVALILLYREMEHTLKERKR